MTGSLAYRKNEDAIFRGDVPAKYTRILPYVTGHKVLEVGSAEGVLSLLLARQGKDVTALERQPERHEAAQRLRDAWDVSGARFICGDIRNNLSWLKGVDTLLAVRVIYYFGDAIDDIFAEVAKHVPHVVLCGNKNRAARWRLGTPDEPLGDFNRYAASEGMTDLLLRHGYRIVKLVTDGDEIVVGRLD